MFSAAPGCSLFSGDDKKDKKSSRGDDDDRKKRRAAEEEEDEPILSKTEQCDRLIKTVNTSNIGDNVGSDKNKLFLEAGAGDRLAKELGALKLPDAELKKLVTDYRANVTEYAGMMRKAAMTTDDDLDGLMKLVKEAGVVAQRNSELTEKINKYCASR